MESENLFQEISSLVPQSNFKIVVLDDDPTGIQTVHDCLLLTNWSRENLSLAFKDKVPLFYVLTNSRSMTPPEARKVTKDTVNAVIRINKRYRFRLIFISRSDSTLRGHFPLEPETIRETILQNNLPVELPVFFIPSFIEAGRFTIGNVHYMKEGDDLVPVAETEFAKDNVFGYLNSDLTGYILEKSEGRISGSQVGFISLQDLRSGTVKEIIEIIWSHAGKEYIIVNALEYADLRKFSLAFLMLFSEIETNAILRTSSSFPKAISGLDDRALVGRKDFPDKPGTGLFIVGSHVNKTTLQLKKLLECKNVRGIEADISEIVSHPDTLLSKIMAKITEAAEQGSTPVIYTSRNELRLPDQSERLKLGNLISDFLVSIVKNLSFSPAYIVAKGGITSHDILTKGLGIENARVMGQVLPGVPVVMTGKTGKFPGIPYVIFPGNVGDENSLKELLVRVSLQVKP